MNEQRESYQPYMQKIAQKVMVLPLSGAPEQA
jgi:hypothetical protein